MSSHSVSERTSSIGSCACGAYERYGTFVKDTTMAGRRQGPDGAALSAQATDWSEGESW